jgi:hypothetical protein
MGFKFLREKATAVIIVLLLVVLLRDLIRKIHFYPPVLNVTYLLKIGCQFGKFILDVSAYLINLIYMRTCPEV